MKQDGGLLIAAILMIVVFGFVAFTIADIDVHSTRTVANVKDHQDSFNVAEAGLNRAKYALATSEVSDQLSCAEITGHADFTGVAFNGGQYTVSGLKYEPSATSLSQAINNATSIIPVDSTAGYASSGLIQIGNEFIHYSSLGSSSAECGSGHSACFLGALRGREDSTAASHSNNDSVAQDMCELTSTGVVPNASNVLGRTVLKVDVTLGAPPVRDWIMGRNKTYIGGDDSTFSLYGPYPTNLNQHLSAVSVISSREAWAVGNDDGRTVNINHWNGHVWVLATKSNGMIESDTTIPRRDIYGITCYDAQNCWAVGQSKTMMRYLLKDGSLVWENASSSIDSSVPTESFYGVSCYSNGTSPAYTETGSTPYSCWAVATPHNSNRSPTFLFWDGTASTPKWTLSTAYDDCVPNNKILRSVSCVSADDCWAVGNRESGSIPSGCPTTKTNIDHWNGTVWTRVAPDENFNNHLYEVVCVSANECYAVGNRTGGHGLVLKYNGTQWSRMNTDNLPNQNLYAIACAGTGDCIAVGNSGTIGKLTGTTWTNVSSPSTERLLGVGMLSNAVSNLPSENYVTSWRED